MDRTGRWVDLPTAEDCWGRSIWGLGTAAARSDVDWIRQSAIVQFERAAQQRSTWPRAMAFAALGAAELLTVHARAPRRRGRSSRTAPTSSPGPGDDPAWPWPEARLDLRQRRAPRGDDRHRRRAGPTRACNVTASTSWPGCSSHETADGPPVAHARRRQRARTMSRPAFDQQPIEVAALADACARAAARRRPARSGPRPSLRAVAWFQGDNDAGQLMWDPETGGGFDGLAGRRA